MSSTESELANLQSDGEAIVKDTSTRNSRTKIWIGYVKHNRHFVDKTLLQPDNKHQIETLSAYYHQQFSLLECFLIGWLLCKVPVIMLGQVGSNTANIAMEAQHFPHPTQFSELTVNEQLTGGFADPETLQDSDNVFIDDPKFHVLDELANRKVLVIGHRLEKRRLVIPLVVSLSLAIIVAVIVCLLTHNMANGLAVGGIFGSFVGTAFTCAIYILG